MVVIFLWPRLRLGDGGLEVAARARERGAAQPRVRVARECGQDAAVLGRGRGRLRGGLADARAVEAQRHLRARRQPARARARARALGRLRPPARPPSARRGPAARRARQRAGAARAARRPARRPAAQSPRDEQEPRAKREPWGGCQHAAHMLACLLPSVCMPPARMRRARGGAAPLWPPARARAPRPSRRRACAAPPRCSAAWPAAARAQSARPRPPPRRRPAPPGLRSVSYATPASAQTSAAQL